MAKSFGKCQKCTSKVARYVLSPNPRLNTVVSLTNSSIRYEKRKNKRASIGNRPPTTRMVVATVTVTMVVPAVVSAATARAHRI